MDLNIAYVNYLELGLRLICAAAAGAFLGLDRELRHRKVGMRTYMIVSLGAAGFTLITMEMSMEALTLEMGADPTRIMQGLVGAIGFLGAGAIIQGEERVGGMATAASLWVAGSVGMASGLGYYVHAVVLALAAAGILAMSRLMSTRGSEDRPDISE
ncbi:MgtC/SapB family protein [Leisingera daeponensis]|uniref:Protein MgtC n=1 Tax=Leisingera daeponensis TaxID=405746 RepID=A0ABS7NGC3_9RHOB|nr:MgtC/SapB family protein [Leisingera daeponensis]MBY6056495.1 MgtC/SapB family protein [Leisingera daeponensis]MBY6140264.1 MgtC/SapB family protein [Leisingera daeponensis]